MLDIIDPASGRYRHFIYLLIVDLQLVAMIVCLDKMLVEFLARSVLFYQLLRKKTVCIIEENSYCNNLTSNRPTRLCIGTSLHNDRTCLHKLCVGLYHLMLIAEFIYKLCYV